MKRTYLLALFAISLSEIALFAQSNKLLPDAPEPHPLLVSSPSAAQGQSAPSVLTLTRQQAEQIAVENNPNIRIGVLLAKVQHQAVRERRADELPNVAGNLTAVVANQASRFSSGQLTASILLDHAGAGIQLNQLVTDFGRTHNLVLTAKLQEKAQNANAEETRQDILLATDEAFFDALEAQATLQVAQQTVATRQDLVDRVSALTAAKLKSDLDLSFAQVNLSQAKLLVVDARNNLDSAKAALTAVLGSDKQTDYQLVDDSDAMPALPPDAESLVNVALNNRPDLQSSTWNQEAAQRFERAQHDQLLPSISTSGIVGATPVGSSTYFTSNWYGALGVNVNVPIFNGFRYTAQTAEASYETKAAMERSRSLRETISRDVRTAWLNANSSLERVSVTKELLKQANLALDLSQTRYRLGLSSIVELSQAQLQQTQAAIGAANARTQYQLAIAALKFQVGGQL